MIKPINKNKLRVKRHKRNRKNILGTSTVPRLYIFKSLKNFYVNLVDDKTGNTLVSVSTLKTSSADISDEVAKKASAITPVPGGVGPMTIACLLRNTKIAFENKIN